MGSAYLYVYDQELGHPRYHKLISRLETRLLELGIKGRTVRLTPLKNLREIVAEAIAQGVQTIVSVGSDVTLNSVVSASIGGAVTVGFIPTDASSTLARVLGIPPQDGAVEVLSARIVKQIDVGLVNGACFIDGATVAEPESCTATLRGFSLKSSRGSGLSISNIGYCSLPRGSSLFDPSDGRLNLTVTPPQGRGQVTHLALQAATIASSREAGGTVLLDGVTTQRTPAKVSILPLALKVIVGADRLFN